MKIRRVAHGIDLLGGSSTGRSTDRPHLSDLYNSLYQEIEPTRYKSATKPPDETLAMGLAWEQYVEKLLIQQGINAARPGEFVSPEGVVLSPDLLIFNGHERIGEIKLTKMAYSLDLGDPKFGKWLVQVKGYAHVLDIPRARFYVLYVNGDYRDKKDPILQAYDLEFSRFELQENWRMLMTYGKQRGLIHE